MAVSEETKQLVKGVLERHYNDGSKIFIRLSDKLLGKYEIRRKLGKNILPIDAESISKSLGVKVKPVESDPSRVTTVRLEDFLHPTQAPSQKPSVKALQTAQELIARGEPYTEAELAILASYEGRGGLAKEGISEKGILNEFYTPWKIIEAMWALVLKNGYKGGPVLEPSCGTGRFFKYLDPSVKAVGYEVDPTSAEIARTLYPWADIRERGFESLFFTDAGRQKLQIVPEFDLVIGNPPYDSFKSHWSMYEKAKVPGATNYHDYFIARGLDVLRPNGVLCMIVPSAFMRNNALYNEVKGYIAQRGELIDAYRLPNDVFHNTYVGTDILLFKRK